MNPSHYLILQRARGLIGALCGTMTGIAPRDWSRRHFRLFMAAPAIGLVATTILKPHVPSQNALAILQPCRSLDHRRLNHWIGRWYIATEEGRLRGESSVTATVGGCALWEEWHGVSGGNGRSISAYDSAAGRWRHLFVNDTGVVVEAEGLPAGDSIIIWSVTHISEPTPGQSERWVWTTSAVSHHVEISTDSGATWRIAFDPWLYVRWTGILPPVSRHNGPCRSTQSYRALDWLLGPWDILDGADRKLGEIRLYSILDGCAIVQQARWNRDHDSMSLIAYDSHSSSWRSVEVSNAPSALALAASVSDSAVTWSVDADRPRPPDAYRVISRGANGYLRVTEASSTQAKTWRRHR
jgi:hypothetical protein